MLHLERRTRSSRGARSRPAPAAKTSVATTHATYGPGSRSRSRSDASRDDRDHDADRQKDRRVLRRECDAERHAGERPTSESDRRRPTVRLERADDAVQSDRRRGEQRRVRRRENQSRRGERQHADDDRAHRSAVARRPSRRAIATVAIAAIQPETIGPSRTASGVACSPSGERSVAAEPNQQRDPAGMIEVAGREMSRPIPVVRLVRKDGNQRGEDQSDDRRDGHDQHGARASGPAVGHDDDSRGGRRTQPHRVRARGISTNDAHVQMIHMTRSSRRERREHPPRDHRAGERRARADSVRRRRVARRHASPRVGRSAERARSGARVNRCACRASRERAATSSRGAACPQP